MKRPLCPFCGKTMYALFELKPDGNEIGNLRWSCSGDIPHHPRTIEELQKAERTS